ncbi:MAG: MaoC family dehydratase [Candidatus Binatia bacterium]
MTDEGRTLPELRIRARNIASASENRIHDDAVARRYGFAGGLVPGIVVYGYMTRPLLDRFGLDWLARGVVAVRFLKPCYDGEEIVVRAEQRSEAIEVVVERGGEVCATGTASLPPAANEPPDPAGWTAAALPKERPLASADSLRPETVLGTVVSRPDPRRAAFAAAIGDDGSWYAGADAALHPGFVLGLANEALARNVALGPWIHAASDIESFSVAGANDALHARARVVDRFDRKGHELVVLDVLVLAGRDRVVQRIRHTAIYRPRPTDR